MLPEFKNIKELVLQVYIVTKSASSAICKVVKVLDNTGKYREPQPNEFPNENTIFVNGYGVMNTFYKGVTNPIFKVPNLRDDLFILNKDFNSQIEDAAKSNYIVSKYMTFVARINFQYLPQIVAIPNFTPYSPNNWSLYHDSFPRENQAFFIESSKNQSLFGPFVYQSVSGLLQAVDYGNISNTGTDTNLVEEKELLSIGMTDILSEDFLEENDGFIFEYKIEEDAFKSIEIEGKRFVQKLSKVRDKHYYGSQEELEFSVKKRLSGIRKADYDLLEKFLAAKENTLRFESDVNIIKKIEAYFGNISLTSDYYKNELPRILNAFLKETHTGRSLLLQFLQENEEGKLLLEGVAQVDPEENEAIKQKIGELESVKADLTVKLQEQEENLARLVQSNTTSKLDLGFDTDDDKAFFLAHKTEIGKIVKDLKEKLRLEIDLEKQVERLETLKKEKTVIIESIEKHLNGFKSTADITAALLAFQTTSDIISGQYDKKVKSLGRPTSFGLPKASKQEISFNEYREEVGNNLKKLGRDIDEVTLSNYLVTLDRNFLTVFLGYPGTGKTSLVERLAKATGLYHKDEKNSRFKKIAVEKGWNSTRDLLGFYNSITNQWVDSKTGLLQVLEQVSFEENKPAPPYWVLLDEANLSPIENYWANFNTIADSDYDKKIVIEDGRAFQWANDKLRFIATLNFDHTTESLSPRLVSRAAVIKLEPTKSFFPESDFSLLNAPMANKVIFEAISEKPIRQRLSKLSDILSDNDRKFGTPIFLSHRKINAILDHFNHLAPVINDDAKALDFAIAQHLLPMIFAQGKPFERRLEELRKNLDGLENSQEEVEHILNKGSDYHVYSFFNL